MAAKCRVDSKKRYKHGAPKLKVRKDYNSRRNERRKDERLKGRLGKDAKVLANKNNELAKKNSRVEEGRQYWKQEALEVRAQKKQIEDNKKLLEKRGSPI